MPQPHAVKKADEITPFNFLPRQLLPPVAIAHRGLLRVAAGSECQQRDEDEFFHDFTTGILPILACHSFGPVMWTEVPWESTATVTGMSCTSNS